MRLTAIGIRRCRDLEPYYADLFSKVAHIERHDSRYIDGKNEFWNLDKSNR